MRIFAQSVFLSAFLLFLVQPMIGKYILPWFGSTPGVWTVCLLFFQTLLLVGYAYAHLLVSRLEPRSQALTHIVLLGLAILTMPITPSESLKPEAGAEPTLRILLLLASSIGAPFLLLSATGPLLMGWFTRTHPDRSPYRLYALSNLGSLLALLSYPFVFERILQLRHQTICWSVAWVACALLVAGCAARRIGASEDGGDAADAVTEGAPRPRIGTVLLWIALAACGSGLLMATTNRLCLDVAVVPLLWILPLALYLLTFIIAFDHDRWYARPFFLMLLPLSLFLGVCALLSGVGLGVAWQIVIGAFTLFVCCMCCHGELARKKPHPRHLTMFYLAVAGGGAAGGLFVAVVAPAVFVGLHEYHLLLAASYVLVTGTVARDLRRSGDLVSGGPAARIAGRAAWAGFFSSVVVITVVFLIPGSWTFRRMDDRTWEVTWSLLRYSRYFFILLFAVLLVGVGGGRIFRRESWAGWLSARRTGAWVFLVTAGVGAVPLFGALTIEIIRNRSIVVAADRNFYGTLSIKEYSKSLPGHEHSLIHGRIFHGLQFQSPERQAWPTTYYGPRSGVGVAIRFHPRRERIGRQFRIGVVGLGTGTLAAYGNARVLPEFEVAPYVSVVTKSPGDYVAFYEINPLVIAWADEHFSYLEDARSRGARIDVFPGDARIVMERQIASGDGKRFDVLAIDAFSSDAIPVHLLTRECFAIYKSHLKDDGILAVHVTNRFLDLVPVVRRLAAEIELPAVFVKSEREKDRGVDACDWVLMTKNPDFLSDVGVAAARDDWPLSGPLWTDDFSSIFSTIKVR